MKQAIVFKKPSEAKKVFMMEAMWSRFLPTYKKAQELIKNGDIGNVKFAQSSFGYPIMRVERVANKNMGGGALLDIG